jgi:DNA-binding MurR/RpiR family transcriptional regulator
VSQQKIEKFFLNDMIYENILLIWTYPFATGLDVMAAKKDTLDTRIRSAYDDLPTSERTLANLLLEFPGDVAIYSATDLAKRTKVSNAAVTRLVKRLGYGDYREAQREVRAQQSTGQPIYLNNSLVQPPTQSDSLAQHVERDVMNLRATFDGLAPGDLDAGLRAILKAEQVWTLGFRNSYFFAAYFRRQLNQVRPRVHLLPLPGQLVMEDLGPATPKDLVVIIGMRRRVSQLDQVMKFLHARNVPILYITDHRAVRTAKLARWVFHCHARGVSLFDSYVPVISLLNYLGTEVMAQAGATGRKRLKQIEEGLDQCGEIDPAN